MDDCCFSHGQWSTQGHLERVGDDRCALVRSMVFANRAMATRANLEREARNWIDAEGTTPPGNGALPAWVDHKPHRFYPGLTGLL